MHAEEWKMHVCRSVQGWWDIFIMAYHCSQPVPCNWQSRAGDVWWALKGMVAACSRSYQKSCPLYTIHTYQSFANSYQKIYSNCDCTIDSIVHIQKVVWRLAEYFYFAEVFEHPKERCSMPRQYSVVKFFFHTSPKVACYTIKSPHVHSYTSLSSRSLCQAWLIPSGLHLQQSEVTAHQPVCP